MSYMAPPATQSGHNAQIPFFAAHTLLSCFLRSLGPRPIASGYTYALLHEDSGLARPTLRMWLLHGRVFSLRWAYGNARPDVPRATDVTPFGGLSYRDLV